MTRNNSVLLLLGTSLLLFALALTQKNSIIGAILGYWVGFLYTQWLYRDTLRSVDLDVKAAIQRMRRSFFTRLGFVTLAVAVVGRVQPSWLFAFALGIALGLLGSLLIGVKEFVKSGKG